VAQRNEKWIYTYSFVGCGLFMSFVDNKRNIIYPQLNPGSALPHYPHCGAVEQGSNPHCPCTVELLSGPQSRHLPGVTAEMQVS